MRTLKLNELNNMMKIIAQKEIEINGEYLCVFNGEKVRVIK